jgi:hypothetical protein
MTNDRSLTLSSVIGGVFKDILFFPFWWYSFGLAKFLIWLKSFLGDKQRSLGLGVWVKNIFVPMYGQRDWQGVLISIFIRIVQIIFRSIAMILWLLVAIVMLAAWLSFPLATVFGIVWQFI